MSDTRRKDGSHVLLHVFLATFTLLAIYPVLWVVSVAFSGTQNLAFADVPPDPGFLDRLRAIVPWPETVSIKNFVDVLTEQPFLTWLMNSAIVATATTVVGVFLACTAAYAFSRFRFPGRQAGMMSFLVSQMFPGTLLLVPLYIIILRRPCSTVSSFSSWFAWSPTALSAESVVSSEVCDHSAYSSR